MNGGEKFLVQCKQWRAFKVLVRPMKEPDVGDVGHQGPDVGIFGLHVLPIHQQVGLGVPGGTCTHPEARQAGPQRRVLLRVLDELASDSAFQVDARVVGNLHQVQQISAIVDACFRLIVDGVSAPSWTRGGCAQARSSMYLSRPRSA